MPRDLRIARTVPQTATPESVRVVNRAVLLSLVRKLQPVSRADLARRSGIFPSNVSRIVETLLEEGLVTETRAKPSGRGKVPMMLRIRDEYFQVLGVNVSSSQTTIAFAGFNGKIHQTWAFPTPPAPKAFVRELSRWVKTIQHERGLPAGSIKHIGIGAPGFVDVAAGRITCVTALLPYSQFPLAEEIKRATGIPVSLDNDCNLGALSELRSAQSRDGAAQRDFLFLSVGDHAIGGGLVIGGMLYRGHDSRAAGEVGHMIVDVDGPQCSCGRFGCLQMFACNTATWSRYKPRTPFSREHFNEMLLATQNGDGRAAKAVQETARVLALAASNIMSVVNPSEIVLAGDITEAFPAIHHAFETMYRSPYAAVAVRRSRLAREASLLHGTVCLALDNSVPGAVFNPHSFNEVRE